VFCASCQKMVDDKTIKYKHHSWRCPTGSCLRLAHQRRKLPWASFNPYSAICKSEEEWAIFVLHSSVWSDENKPTPLLEYDVKQGLVWRRNKKKRDYLRAVIPRSDVRVMKIEAVLRPLLGAECTIAMLEARRKPESKEIYEYYALMAKDTTGRSTAFCQNYRNPHITRHYHNRQTFVTLKRLTFEVDDFSCLAERKARSLAKGHKKDESKTPGLFPLTFTPHEKGKKGTKRKTRDDDEHGFTEPLIREYDMPAVLISFLFPSTGS